MWVRIKKIYIFISVADLEEEGTGVGYFWFLEKVAILEFNGFDSSWEEKAQP